MQFQRFRLDQEIQSIEVRQSLTGQYYSEIDDIRDEFDEFPNTFRFKVNGVSILFLQDPAGKRYEPSRIAHYPDDIVDVVVAAPKKHPVESTLLDSSMANTPLLTPVAEIAAFTSPALPSLALPAPLPIKALPSPDLSTPDSPSEFDVSMPATACELNLSKSPITQTLNTLVTPTASQIALHPTASQITLHPTTSVSSVSSFSTMQEPISAREISLQFYQIQHQIAQSTDLNSEYHTQTTEKLLHLVEGQAKAKERDEQQQRSQQIMSNQLAVLQRKIEAVLVQNYELHEYPIPRLFVILPEKQRLYPDGSTATRDGYDGGDGLVDTIKGWDPRHLVQEKFRLHFLCECGEHTKADSDVASMNSSLSVATRTEHRIHLAKQHDGYELTRPTKFFEQYGPYVLGMLLILKHCLTAASVIAPAVGQLQEGLGKVTEGLKSVTDDTMDAINASIGFLEQKLMADRAPAAAGLDAEASEGNLDPFKHLDALEGADLRRLESFLRNKDKDKVLGNLYRITTTQGHVKWVCLEHYRESYREIAMKSFLQTVKENLGQYDVHLRKVEITLVSSTQAKDFFKQLGSQAPAVNEIDVIFDWSFGSSDLSKMVEGLSRSNVRIVRVDLKDEDNTARPDVKFLGKGKYHPLLELLANRYIQLLSIKNLEFFGSRTSSLSSSHPPSQLRSFYYQSVIRPSSDQSRLANILNHCPNLVELKMGSGTGTWSEIHPELSMALSSLKCLQLLHLFKIRDENGGAIKNLLLNVATATVVLRELVLVDVVLDDQDRQEAIQAFANTLEVAIFDGVRIRLDLVPILGQELSSASSSDAAHNVDSTMVGMLESMALVKSARSLKASPFRQLTQFSLQGIYSPDSMELLALTLPHLYLTHLGLGENGEDLLQHVNYDTLRSLYLHGMSGSKLQLLWDLMPSTQIDTLSLDELFEIEDLPKQLKGISLRRLWISSMEVRDMPGSCGFSSMEVRDMPGSRGFSSMEVRDMQGSHGFSSTTRNQQAMSSRQGYFNTPSINTFPTRPNSWLVALLSNLDLSQLDVLALVKCNFDAACETILAAKANVFTEELRIHIGRTHSRPRKVAPGKTRLIESDTLDLLPRERVHMHSANSAADYTLLRYQLMSDTIDTFATFIPTPRSSVSS
ncbi:hypothetical protein BGZ99_009417 [Dissophora globulifera]|uniref:Uncharacterized protein n=1 Tax=Dissophora globulifera TaxID=979702 RepID=A0A9P6RYT7_9FUNG|nr:hypothetical protein BGZ99_009417 [Dissophora globulifera]